MALDHGERVVVEGAALREDAVRHGDLADVVEEAAEAHGVESLSGNAELLRDGESDPLHAGGVSRGVRILRVDGRIQALDRLERALLEPAVRVHQLAGARLQRRGLATQPRRRIPDEQRQGAVEGEEHRDDCGPDQSLSGRDERLRVLRLRVDLVGADRVLAVVALQRRVDLEDPPVVDRALLGLVLLLVELADRGVRLVLADRFAELTLERELLPDPFLREVRPDEDAVRAPDLDADDVRLTLQLLVDLAGEMWRDVDAVALDDLRPEHAVDVLGHPRAGVVERLPAQAAVS